MEAIGRLAGGIAHDFNNVLGVIFGYCSMLMDKLESDSALYSLAANFSKSVQRGATLTRQLLAFSRQQVLQPQVIDINAHFKGFEGLLRRVIGEDIELSVINPNADLRLRADPDQLEQVIMNLVVNARDAMVTGGKLVIETAELRVDEEYCRGNPDAKPGEYVMIAISDTGCGMDRETLARVFEPFFTTKEQGKGTGLGLATVLRDREAKRRARDRLQRAWPWHDVQDSHAALPGRGRAGGLPCGRHNSAIRYRDDSPRGR